MTQRMPHPHHFRSWARGTLLLVLAGLILLPGCGLFEKENTRPPSPLPEIETTLTVRTLWKRSAGSGIDGQFVRLYPLFTSHSVFVADYSGDVVAMDLENGSRRWSTSLDVPVGAGAAGNEDVVAIGTEDGFVIALNALDGEERWRRELSSEVMALSPADLGVLVARTNDSRVYGLDTDSGDVIWQTGQTAPLLLLRGQSRPLVDGGRVVVGYDSGKLVAIALSRGTVLWQVAVDVPEGASELERMVDIDGTLKISDGVVYGVAFHGKVGGVSLSDGRLIWTRDFSSYQGLDVDDYRLYVTDDDGNVWALDRNSGASMWKQDQLTHRMVTAPVALDDYVVVGDFEGYLHWMDKEDGHFVARTRVDGDGILTPPTVVNGRLYVLGNGGTLAVLEPESPYLSDAY